MTDIRPELLGEEDFLSAMQGPFREWLQGHVKKGDLRSADGLRLRYYFARQENALATVVIFHGLCEFFVKYHELAWYLFRSGYSFFFLEQRGHGHSEGKLPEPDADVIHIENYDQYVRDQHLFIEEIVIPQSEGRPLLLYSHSMGGAIAALYLETYPDTFRGGILSSPMFRLRTVHPSMVSIALYWLFIKLLRKGHTLAPGEQHFSPEPKCSNEYVSSARYHYTFSQRMRDRSYQTSCVSLSWVLASVLAARKALRKAGRIRVPLALLAAENDKLVDEVGHSVFMHRAASVQYICYSKSEHEIYNACDGIRRPYYADVFRILQEMTKDRSEVSL